MLLDDDVIVDGVAEIEDLLDTDTKWTTMIPAAAGALQLTNNLVGPEYAIVDNISAPAVKYGTLTVDADGSYSLEVDVAGITSVELGAASENEPVVFEINGNGFTSEAAVTVTTTGGSGIVSVNGTEFDAKETALTINATPDAVTLTEGTVNVTGRLALTSDSDVTVTADLDGVVVAVTGGTVNSITGLTIDGSVTFGDKTYTMIDDGDANTDSSILKVTTVNDTGTAVTIYDGAGEATNLLDITALSAINYIQIVNDKLDLAAGIAAIANGGRVIYGTVAETEFNGAYNFELTSSGAYALTQVEETNVDIVTSDVTAAITLTTDFDANVITAAGATITVNGDTYTAADTNTVLTIAADYDSDEKVGDSTLFDGTVALSSTSSDVMIYDATVVTRTAGDITVTAVEGTATAINSLDSNDAFTVDGEAYLKTIIGMVKLGDAATDSDNTIWTAGTATSVTFAALENADFNPMIQMDTATGTVDVTGLTEDGTAVIVNSFSTPTATYGTVVKDNSSYTIAGSSSINVVVLGDEDAELTVDGSVTGGGHSVTVKTAQSSATYKIDGIDFTAAESELEIITAGRNQAALNNGTVNVVGGNNLYTTSDTTAVVVSDDSDGVFATASDGTVVAITGLTVGGKVELNNVTYEMVDDGDEDTDSSVLRVTTKDSEGTVISSTLYNGAVEATNILAPELSTITYIPLKEDGTVLDLATGIAALAADSDTRVIYGIDDEYAGAFNFELTSDNTYALTVNGEEITVTVDATEVADGIALTTDFTANVNAAAGATITVNDATYTADNVDSDSQIVISATYDTDTGAATSTLFNGTVVLDSESDTVTTSDDYTVDFVAGEVKVTADEGVLQSIDVLNETDSFSVTDAEGNTNTYVMVEDGRLIRDENAIWTGTAIADDENVSIEDLLDDNNWQNVVIIDSDTLTLNSDTVDVDGTYLVVDSAFSKVYGTLELDAAQGVYTLTADDADTDAAIVSIVVDGVEANIAEDFEAVPITAVNATFTVDAGDMFTVDATGETAEVSGVDTVNLTEGRVALDEGAKVIHGNAVFGIDKGGYTAMGILDDDALQITDITAEDAEISGDTVNVTVQTDELNKAEITYTISDQTYTVKDDNSEGITFTINSDGKVSDISGLGDDATLKISVADSDVDVIPVINTNSDLTIAEVEEGVLTVVGVDNETNAVPLLKAEQYFMIEIDSDGAMSIYRIDSDDRTIDTEEVPNPDDYATFDNGVVELVAGKVPSEGLVVIANESDSDVTLKGAGENTIYVQSMTEIGDGVGIQVVDSANIQIVSVADGVVSEDLAAIPESGTIGLASNVTLIAEGLVVTTADVDGTVEFGDDITLDGAGMTATGEGLSFVLTAVESTDYTINDVAYDVLATATLDSDATLIEGTVQVVDSINTLEGEIAVSDDADGVTVVVDSEGTVTSITLLSANGIVAFNGKVYSMTDSRLQIVDSTGTITFYDGGEDVNILDPQGEATLLIVVGEDGIVDLSKGVTALATYDAAEYGMVDSDTGEITSLTTLTVDSDTGIYEFTGEAGLADVTDSVVIDATAVTDLAGLKTDFDANVSVPADKAILINDTLYKTVAASVIAANADGSAELAEGTVTVDSDTVVVTTTGGDIVAADSDSSITATADSDGALAEIGDIDGGEIFNVNGAIYVQTPIGLVNGANELLTSTIDSDVTADEINGDDWEDMIAVDSDGYVALADLTDESAIIVDDVTAPANNYGTLEFDSDTAEYTVPVSDNVKGVKTADPGVYTINGVTFNAIDALTIDGTTLTAGTVTLDSDTTGVITTAGNTIDLVDTDTSVTVNVAADSDGAVVLTVADVNIDESFKIDAETYTQTGVGLRRESDGALLKDSRNVVSFTYPGDDWGVAVTLDENGTIALSSDTTDPTTFVTSDSSAFAATYKDGVLKADDGVDDVKSIDVADAPVELVGFNSDTEITSGSTAFTANDDDADFTVDPTTEPVKVDDAGEINLTEGEVTVDGTDTSVIPNGDSDSAITPADSDTELIVSADGTISGIDEGESFKVGNETYTQTPIGLMNSDGEILTTVDSDVTLDELADSDSWMVMVEADSDGYVALANVTTAEAIIVDSITAPTANYGTIMVDSDTSAYTFTDANYDAVKGVKTDSDTYIVNGEIYVGVDEMTISVTADGTSLYDGAVLIDSSDDTEAPASVVIGSKTIEALGTDLIVTAENGEAKSISDIEVGEKFSITENGETVEYIRAEAGLMRNVDETGGELLDSDSFTSDTYNFSGNWSTVKFISDGKLTIDSDTADGTIFMDSDMTTTYAEYTDGKLESLDDEAVADITVSIDGDLNVDLGAGFAATDNKDGTKVEMTTSLGGFLSFILGVLKNAVDTYFGIRGSSGAAVVTNAGTLDLIEGTATVDAGTTVSTIDGEGNVINSVNVGSTDFTINVDTDGAMEISDLDSSDFNSVNVSGTVTITTTPTTDEAGSTYDIGTQEFNTRAKDSDASLTFTLTGTSTDSDTADTKVTAIDNLAVDATITVTDSNADSDANTVAINDVNYTATDDPKTVVGIITDDEETGETGVLRSTELDSNSYYVIINEDNTATVYFLDKDRLAIDRDRKGTFADFTGEAEYDGNGIITMKSNADGYIVPSSLNAIIIANNSDNPITLRSGSGTEFLTDFRGLTAQFVNGYMIKLVSEITDEEGNTSFADLTAVPENGTIGVPALMVLQAAGLTFENTTRDTNGTVEFGDTITLGNAALTVTGVTDETFVLGTTEATYQIGDLSVTASAEENDTVAFSSDGTVTLTSAGTDSDTAMTATGTGTFVLAGNGTYTLNEIGYIVVEDATINADNILTNGAVVAMDSVTVPEGTLTVSEDSDGVAVAVDNGTTTSITLLSEGGEVDFNGNTYEMLENGRLKVTDADGKVTFYDDSDETTNLLALEGGIPFVEVDSDNTIVLADGVAEFAADSDTTTVEYGTIDSDTGEITPVATLTVNDSDTGAYTLTASDGADSDTVIDAAGVGELTTSGFNGNDVLVPQTDAPVTINDAPYQAVDSDGIVVEANDGSSALAEGTAALNSDTANTITTAGEEPATVEVTAGDGITATVDSDGNLAEISGLNNGDAFSVDEDNYKVTPVGILAVDENGEPTEMYTGSDTDALAIPTDSDAWTAVSTVDPAEPVDLAGIDSDRILLTPDGNQIVATVDYTEATDSDPATYAVTAGDGLSSDTTIALGEEPANLTTNFETTVTTPENGSGAYEVNGTEFKAAESPLTIDTTPLRSTATLAALRRPVETLLRLTKKIPTRLSL